MITCRELIDFLAEYLEGTLPPGDRAAFEEHIAVCPECQNYVENYRQTVVLGDRAFNHCDDDEVPPSVPADLINAILALRPK